MNKPPDAPLDYEPLLSKVIHKKPWTFRERFLFGTLCFMLGFSFGVLYEYYRTM